MQHYTKIELKNLLEVAKRENEMHYLMILVGFWHGLRASEICNLKGNQIKDGYLTVQRLKGSLKTVQPLVEDDEPILNEKPILAAAAKGKGSARLFPEVTRQLFWYYVHKYGKMAGIPEHKNHPHVLKHTTAMLTIKEAGIENVRAYLGHKSISSTGAYLKVDDETASQIIISAVAK